MSIIAFGLGFVNFKKTFDTLETTGVISAMTNARIDQRFINPIYRRARLKIRLHAPTKEAMLQSNVTQGDIISPKFFIHTFEDVFNASKWDNLVLNKRRITQQP